MMETPILNLISLELFNEFVIERETIRLKREMGESAPWTTNHILSNYRFCNIRREDDKNSKWIIENIALSNIMTLENKIANTLCARMYNNIDTMNLMFPRDYNVWVDSDLDDLDAVLVNQKYLCNAYMPVNHQYAAGYFSGITGKFNGKTPSGKPAYYRPTNLLRLGHEFMDNRTISDIISLCKLASTGYIKHIDIYKYLRGLPTMGEFMGYQHFVDLTYIPELEISEDHFTIAGPGCVMGLQCLFAEKLSNNYRNSNNTPNLKFKVNWGEYNQDDIIIWMRDNWSFIVPHWPFDWKPTLMCIENMLCEGHKYIKTHMGWGKPRNNYKPIVESTTPSLF